MYSENKPLFFDSFTDSELRERLKSLPKVELHRHLAGAVTPEIFLSLIDSHSLDFCPHDIAYIKQHLQVPSELSEVDEKDGLKEFIKRFDFLAPLFSTLKIVEDMAYKVIEAAHNEGIAYCEFRFSPMYIATVHGLSLKGIVESVLVGVKRAALDFPIHVKLILIAERQMGPEEAEKIAQLARDYKEQGILGFDLANNEYDFPPAPYASLFQKMKSEGFGITVHAGEVPVHQHDPNVGGANNIRVSVEQLKADRIGHGIRAIDDDSVMKLLVDKGIVVECCPTSNVQTRGVNSLEEHPIKSFLQAGIKVTINNDDPGISGVELADEYLRVIRTFRFEPQELMQFVKNSIEATFLPESEKAMLREQIIPIWAEWLQL